MIMIDEMSVRFGIIAPGFVQIVVRYRHGRARCKGAGAGILPSFSCQICAGALTNS